ncbi:MAG: 2-oxoglutarate dehydrogenase complex dihydrolipoyllysine-residue succinyltransferase [Mucilaginibacter polytrichastri]|nr:2-oxoglutarate dehydrogenase complex dihydrolipoyllysine-residue succinyltransferase [Mucilaginibacter polytrichastri]
MSLDIKVPAVGESITEVTLSKWVKNDGDAVEMDEIIAELESDKATFELTAETAGTLKTKVAEGDTIAVGGVVASIEEGGSAKAAPKEDKAEEAAPQAEAAAEQPAEDAGAEEEIKVPAVGESISEVTLSRWIKKDGDQVEMDEAIAELESDKATFELTATKGGVLKTRAEEGATLAIGDVVAAIAGGASSGSKTAAPAEPAKAEESAPKNQGEKSYADKTPSPSAAKILSEKGIDPKDVNSTGVGGRITKEDALKSEKSESQPKPETQKSAAAAPAAPAVKGERNERREKMSSLRKTVARRLVSVKNETAMLTTFNEVDMKPVMDLRAKYKDKFKEKYGIGLGFMSFFTKAVCEALKDFPAVGARIDGDEVVYSDFADISIAVSAPKGLVVPIIRNADSMALHEIEKAVATLAGKARDNKLTMDEMTGGTFTITNGGVFGSMMSTPIINAPQSAILGMHNIVERPVAINGEVKIRPIMYIALSYDHRIIDGRESVSFLVKVKQYLEDPARLLLGI